MTDREFLIKKYPKKKTQLEQMSDLQIQRLMKLLNIRRKGR